MSNIFEQIDGFFEIVSEIGFVCLTISLFFWKVTRKFAFKVLGICLTVIAVIFTASLISGKILGDAGISLPIIICFDIFFICVLCMSLKELILAIKLHFNGERTTGIFFREVFRYRIRNLIHVEFSINGTKYICNGERFKSSRKLKCGDEVLILYDSENPEKSCIYKYSITLNILPTILELIVTVYYTGHIIYVLFQAFS